MSAFLVIATPLRRLVRPFLLKPGEGPDKETRENGWFRGLFVAKLHNGDEKRFEIFGSGDPGYKSTSKMVCESALTLAFSCLLYTSPSPRDRSLSRMPSSA